MRVQFTPFELVPATSDTPIDVGEPINITFDIGVNKDGASAYEVWESYSGNEGKTIEQYYLLPCADIFGESGISKVNMAAYSTDLIHTNVDGGKLIAAIVAETMLKVFKF